MSTPETLTGYLSMYEEIARREWHARVTRTAIDNMQRLAAEAGIMPGSWGVWATTPADAPIRTLAREFGYDV